MPFSVPPQVALTRETFSRLRRLRRGDQDTRLDEALTALDGYDPLTGQTDTDLLSDRLQTRYGMGIVKDPASGYGVYKHGQFTTALNMGGIERVSVRTYRRICEVLANLFTAPDQSWSYTDPDGQDLDEAGQAAFDVLDRLREEGRFAPTLVRADRVAVALGSCLLRVLWRSGRLVYETVPPQIVFLGFGRQVDDGGGWRSVDTGDIEDASVVVIHVPRVADESGDQRKQWIAYSGRSEGYPAGRCVEYLADNWFDIPEPGMSGILYEHETGNPLTALQNAHGADAVPFEYPLVPFYGTDSPTVSALPTAGLSLYDSCLELDVAWSRLLYCALTSAAKTAVHTRTEASPMSPPATIMGACSLQPGDGLEWKGAPTGDVEAASRVVRDLTRTIAESWNVSGHLVAQDAATAPESGYAMSIRMQPLIEHRNSRIAINRPQVARLFALERSIIWAATGNPPWDPSIRQAWHPGDVAIPRDDKETLENIATALGLKLIDIVEAAREYHEFATDDAAEKYLAMIASRSLTTALPRNVSARNGRAGPVVPGQGAAMLRPQGGDNGDG